jgi:hypothetical protein
MPYFTITDFAAGLDLRRSALTAPPGTLRELLNAHVTPGGEIEKRFAFIPFFTVPPESKGLIELQGKLYTFVPGGSDTTDPTDPWEVGTMQLDCDSIEQIIDYDYFTNEQPDGSSKSSAFVVAYVDGNLTDAVHFYDGVRVPDAEGLYVRTYKNKIFSVAGALLHFSADGDPTIWDDLADATAGFIDLGIGDSDMSDAIALEVYYDKLAILSKTATQLWVIDPDPVQTNYAQTLRQAGTVAPQSVLSYGSGDVLYVAPDGIRSLRARNASLAASVSDVGSPLDPVMQGLFRANGEPFMNKIISIVQPVTGRFWVILPDRVYILSAFPGPKITAWSQYNPSVDIDGDDVQFSITAACQHRQHIVVRDENNNIIAYGGADDTSVNYDSCPVSVVFPYLTGTDKAATQKTFHGIDAAASGVWDVYVGLNPEDETAEDYVGQIIGASFMQGRQAMEGRSTHISMRLRSTKPGPLTLSNLVVHFDTAEAS